MTWGKVSDDLHSHPKWTGASVNAKAMWTTALSYCSGYLTDGNVVEREHLATIAVETFGLTPSASRKAKAAADELVERGLWKRTADGWCFHDWKDNNPTAASVRKRKKKDKRREWLHKTDEGKALKRIVRDRDGDICSWCDEPVRWGANRAPDGATYDHVLADGPDAPSNLVVSCNACNGTKRDVDHDEIGMHLRAGHALSHLFRKPDAAPSASSRLSPDSVATELPHMSEAGAGRVGFGSGRGAASTAVLDDHEAVPPPDDEHYPGEGHPS